MLSIVRLNTVTKSNLERGGLWVPLTVDHRGKTKQELKQELRCGWTTEESSYCFAPHYLLSLLVHTTQHHLPRGAITHTGLGLPTSVIDQESAPQACL